MNVTLTGTNDVPVITAEDLSGAVLEPVSPAGNLTDSGIINFSDVDLTDSHSVTEVTSPNPTLGALTAAITADTVGGSGGVLTWNYSVAAAAVEFLAQDEVRTEVFDVSFSDGKGGTLIKTVNVTLTGTNDVPTFYLDSTGNADSASTTLVETNSGLTANGTLTLTDADTTDTLSTSVASVDASGMTTGLGLTNEQLLSMLTVSPTTGLAANTGDAHNLTWSFNSGAQAFDYLAAGQTLTLNYTLQAHDGSGAANDTGSQAVTITITGSDDAASASAVNATGTNNVPVFSSHEVLFDFNNSPTIDTNYNGYAFKGFSWSPYMLGDGDTSMAFTTQAKNIFGETDGTIERVDGKNFSLESFRACTFGSSSTTVMHGYDNGVEVAERSLSLQPGVYQTFTFDAAWASIDQIRFDSGVYTILDNVTISDATLLPALPPTNPDGTTMSAADVAGAAINLALTNALTDSTDLITLTVSGMPTDWTLYGGVKTADNVWTVSASDLHNVAVTPANGFIGAKMLTITESWLNTDGSTSNATIVENVKAYALGSPILAGSGNDNLTGSAGSDVFVFGPLSGNDSVFNFDTAGDKIDLMGIAGVTGFADVQSYLSMDATGNALISFSNQQTITLKGIDITSLNAGNFVFNTAPVTHNTGTNVSGGAALLGSGSMVVGNGAMLPLTGVIDNNGTIALQSAGGSTKLELIGAGITLQGQGHVTMTDSDGNIIVGSSPSAALTNWDNTISGAGQLGGGQMSLDNRGTITADGAHALTIDTGSHAVVNSGTLEAVAGASLVINSEVSNSGLLWAHGGRIIVNNTLSGGSELIDNGGIIEFGGTSSANIHFGDANPGAWNVIKLNDVDRFSGSIANWDANDELDLVDIDYNSATMSYAADTGLLTVSDGVDTLSVTLIGQYTDSQFLLDLDGTGGTLITCF